MQLENKAKVNYEYLTPSGLTAYFSAESNTTQTNLKSIKPPHIIIDRTKRNPSPPPPRNNNFSFLTIPLILSHFNLLPISLALLINPFLNNQNR